jgi:anti-sigma regulatory factor (Ser/Thr protein kinase)
VSEFLQVEPAVPQSVSLLRHAVSRYARSHGAGADVVASLELAVSEAMSNAVVHAFIDRPEPGSLTVSADRDGDMLIVHVVDDGSGMRPRPDSPGLGVGVPLMTRVTQSLEFREAHDGGTGVAMRFALS